MNALLKFGELNPQAAREFKGRLKGRNVAIAIATSLICQALIVFSYAAQLPGKNSSILGAYCVQDGQGH